MDNFVVTLANLAYPKSWNLYIDVICSYLFWIISKEQLATIYISFLPIKGEKKKLGDTLAQQQIIVVSLKIWMYNIQTPNNKKDYYNSIQ